MAYTGGRSRVSNAWAPQRAGKGRRRAPRARDGDAPVGVMSERRAARRAAASLTLGWLASPVYHSQQSKIGSCGWCVGSRRGGGGGGGWGSSRMTGWRASSWLGQHLHTGIVSGTGQSADLLSNGRGSIRAAGGRRWAAPRRARAAERGCTEATAPLRYHRACIRCYCARLA